MDGSGSGCAGGSGSGPGSSLKGEEGYNPDSATGDTDSEDSSMECETPAPAPVPSISAPTAPPGQSGGGDWADNLGGLSELLAPPLRTADSGSNIPEGGPGQPTEGPASAKTVGKHTEQTFKGPVLPETVENRAKAHVKKQKEKQIEELKKKLGVDLLTYEAVKAANHRRLSAPYLQSGGTVADHSSQQEGDFFSNADGRVIRMYMESNLPRKTNTAFSFNPWKKICNNCSGAFNHPVMGVPIGDRSATTGREVIILSDCSYPPMLPSSSDKKCMRIIRLEHGNICDLTTILLDQLQGRRLSDGSVVMVFSAAHLALVGLTGYIEDLVAARRRLLTALGKNIYFTAAPPLLLGGSRCSELVKNIFALVGWAGQTFPEEIRLEEASNTALNILLENGHGGAQPATATRVRLPLYTTSIEPSKIWTVGSNSKLPNMTSPATEEQEERVVISLIKELQLNLAMDLDENPVTDRHPGPLQEHNSDNFLIVGSSNARRLEEAMKRKGVLTGFVFSSNWRASKQSVVDMANHVKEELDKRPYNAVVFQLLDNNMFFMKGEDGSKALPKKDPDGKFHIIGDLAVADKDSQYAILKLCEPLWQAAKGTNMVVVSPMGRFVSAGCCGDPEHVTNRGSEDFFPKLKEELAACSGNIKNYLFTNGLRHGRVMDPARCMRDMSADEIWGSDPIHPREEIYSMIADGVLTVEKTCGSGQKKRKFAQADNTTFQGGHPARAGHHWQGIRSNSERHDINWRGGRGYSPGAGGGHSHGRSGGGGPDNWSRPERMPRGGRGRPRGGRYRW